VQRVDLIDVPFFVNYRNTVLPEENKLGMQDMELLPVCRANLKRAKSAAAHLFFQFLNVHGFNLCPP
jgi:hypothetical protein